MDQSNERIRVVRIFQGVSVSQCHVLTMVANIVLRANCGFRVICPVPDIQVVNGYFGYLFVRQLINFLGFIAGFTNNFP